MKGKEFEELKNLIAPPSTNEVEDSLMSSKANYTTSNEAMSKVQFRQVYEMVSHMTEEEQEIAVRAIKTKVFIKEQARRLIECDRRKDDMQILIEEWRKRDGNSFIN